MSNAQQLLFDVAEPKLGKHGTFSPNHRQSIHRWYPYIEGFSTDFVRGLIDEFGFDQCRIYDPFAGTGTTVTTAAFQKCVACYSEINPVMRMIIECKTNGLRAAARKRSKLSQYFAAIVEYAQQHLPNEQDAKAQLASAFGDKEYFLGRNLIEVIGLKVAIKETKCPNPVFHDLARLVIAAIAVSASDMKRAADLRYRHPKERQDENFSAIEAFRLKADTVVDDIQPEFASLPAVECISHSALDVPKRGDIIDLLITSPPYVNGTNYFRNTKLELWLAGFIDSETELGGHRDRAVAAGINNISKRGRQPTAIDSVEKVALQLDKVAYDKRIPELIRRYFSDSQTWIQNAFQLLKPGGTAVVDIGDSRYAGVHVPADDLLVEIAKAVGFEVPEVRTVRSRTAKDGVTVGQVLIVMKKPSGRVKSSTKVASKTGDSFLDEAVAFGRDLPHLDPPYSSRNWGHGLHSLCSYQGKLKPAIANILVDRFTEPKQRVLDPLSGCGTIPLEAFLQGRQAIGNDLQELAYMLTRAKIEWGDPAKALDCAVNLIAFVKKTSGKESVEAYSDFGFNGKLPEYFHTKTYQEILAARKYMQKNPCGSWAEAIVYSSVLHILHGNRPYALSRRSHPVTPFKPIGEFEYRPLEPRLLSKLDRSLKLEIPFSSTNSSATLGSYDELKYRRSIDAIITSPPFAASTRFFSTNWMRLWMAGWEPADFDAKKGEFIEQRQKESMSVYADFFSKCANWLRPDGRLILHLGKTAKCDMAKEIEAIAPSTFDLVYQFNEDVAGREKFGLRDQGATTSHQYMFFRRKK
ncbi:DNA methylase [bacterium]|nr:DNA methylase [bacterium]